MRILLSYSPIDFDENEIPLAMGLMDVVITRERLNKRPLKLDEAEGGWDVMWRETTEANFDGLAQSDQVITCEMKQFIPDDEARQVESPSLELTSLDSESKGESSHHQHHANEATEEEEGEQFVYRRAFPGGLLVESEAIVYPGMPTCIRLVHAPSPDEALLYSADLTITALERPTAEEVATSGEVRLRPPRLLDLSVAKRRTASTF